MPDKKISELNLASIISPVDLVPIVDVSGTPETKRATVGDLCGSVLSDLVLKQAGVYISVPAAAAFSAIGWQAATVTAISNTPTSPDGSSAVNSIRRNLLASAASAGAIVHTRHTAAGPYRRGAGATVGGFRCAFLFTTEDAATVAGARMFVGMWSTPGSTPTNVEPSSYTDVIGVCQLSTSPNLHVVHNDGSGTATTVDLGSNYPVDGNAYSVTFSAPNNGNISYRVERIGTAFVAEGTLTTDLVTNTVYLSPVMWRSNNATALAVRFGMGGMFASHY